MPSSHPISDQNNEVITHDTFFGKLLSTNHRMMVYVWMFGHVQLCATPWTVAHHDPLSVGFSGQEYWSGLTCGKGK